MIIGNLKLGKNLIQSFDILKKSQLALKKDVAEYKFYGQMECRISQENFLSSFKKNFFTLLMLSLLKESGIKNEKIISYGKIIILLRQIVTSVDNILDDERKGIIFIEGMDNLIVESSLINLVAQDLLTKEITKLESDRTEKKASRILLEKIYSIAKGESLRRRSLYEKYPNKEYIIENIHGPIGGELLEISLTVPMILEENNLKLNAFREGLFKIGMSLQALDDFFDMEEDYEKNNINLSTGDYIEKYNISEEKIDFKNLEKEFVESYMNKVINEAYEGFDILKSNGFPLSEKDGKYILRKLFIIRGLEDYIEYIK